jgi:lon-related putative ATP-dependent protease
MTTIKALPAEALFTPCDAASLEFETTNGLDELTEIAGQERALEALRFGVGIQREGFNLFVMGPSGMGKHTMVQQYLERQAAEASPPDDWCYVNNFEQPHKPIALRLPAGMGSSLRWDIQELIEDLRNAMPSAFESDQYQTRVEEISAEVKGRREKALTELAEEAKSHHVRLVRTTSGFSFMPLKDDEVVTPDEYAKLSAEERKHIEEIVAVLQEKLESIIRQVYQSQRRAKEKLREVNQEVALSVVGIHIDDLKKKYQDIACVGEHLDALQQDVIEHTDDFLSDGEGSPGGGGGHDAGVFRRYQVNVLVDNSEQQGLPIRYENTPSYDNLIGRVEHIAQMGTLITDFGLIKPGALHLANGGYLILDVAKVLTQPYAWEGLKRALRAGEVRIQSLGQVLSLVSTVSLEPEPIPLNLKVVLLGERQLFYLLLEYDPEFPELFKVSADFEDSVARSSENQQIYARMIATIIRREELLPFDREAVARVIERSARLASDAEKLSNHLLSVGDLLREADYWAREQGHGTVGRADVQRAIDAQISRADRIRQRIYEEIQRGTILIDTDGEKTGQVNGLSVIDLGNFSFAQPFRITATVRLGHGDVVDIEREVELGGAIHSKGVLILSSFLGERYAKDLPLSLTASLVFEQSYGMVEGDSASMAELCALLSVLAGAPIRQWLAMTGSVNQHGRVQAIGGVNEKIEGFFDVCSQVGLNGRQGVIIPASNVKHLMLRHDVVQAAAEGRFHIYPIETVDDAIELLTGVEAGVVDAQGAYPEGSINRRVQARLDQLNKLRQEFGEAEKEEHR